MKIQHINLARGWRGGERQTLFLMQGLRDRGIESALVARAGEPIAERARTAGFQVRTIRKPFALQGGVLGECDIVHCHEAHGLQLAALWKRIHGCPIVMTRRVDFAPNAGVITRWKYARVDRVVAISQRVREIMEAWGMAATKLSVIYSAIREERRDNPETVARLRQRFDGKRVIGTVAALVGHKDLPTLLRAAARLKGRPDLQFLIVGEGELRPMLERQIAELGLTNVTLEGYQQDPYSYYPVFDVFALTSNEEGLGSAILDAFLYEVPVVATAGGGIPELVRPDETGVLCPIGDDAAVATGIARVLDDALLRQKLIAGARKHLATEFTVSRMASKYQQLYLNLVATQR